MNALGSISQIYMLVLLILLAVGVGLAIWRFISYIMSKKSTKKDAEKKKTGIPISSSAVVAGSNHKQNGGSFMKRNGWLNLAAFSLAGLLVSVIFMGFMYSRNNASQQAFNGNSHQGMQAQGGMNVNTPMGNVQMQGAMYGNGNYQQQIGQMQQQMAQMQQQNGMNGMDSMMDDMMTKMDSMMNMMNSSNNMNNGMNNMSGSDNMYSMMNDMMAKMDSMMSMMNTSNNMNGSSNMNGMNNMNGSGNMNGSSNMNGMMDDMMTMMDDMMGMMNNMQQQNGNSSSSMPMM